MLCGGSVADILPACRWPLLKWTLERYLRSFAVAGGGVLRIFAIAALELCPWTSFHVAQQRSLPGKLRMLRQEIFGTKICTARMPCASDELHPSRHVTVGSFALHRASGKVWLPFPHFYPTRTGIAVAT